MTLKSLDGPFGTPSRFPRTSLFVEARSNPAPWNVLWEQWGKRTNYMEQSLISALLFKALSAFYGTRSLTVLTRAHQLSPTLFLSSRYILIPFSHVHWSLTIGFFQPNLHIQLLLNGYRYSFLRVKRWGLYVDHSPPSSAEVKNERGSNPTPPTRLRGLDRNNFTFYFLYMYQLLHPTCPQTLSIPLISIKSF